MNTDLQIERWTVDRLIPYARNARTHSPEQVAQIAASIAEFGFVNPVLVGADGVIIAGHARVMAARKLGMTEVPVIVLDYLSAAQRRALVIADNRLAQNAGWDEEMLRVEPRRCARMISTWICWASASTRWMRCSRNRKAKWRAIRMMMQSPRHPKLP